MIRRLLVANRGEIACRIFDTCHRLGIETVAVFCDPDADGLHVRRADQAIRLGSYLDIEAVVAAARRSGADAIHPGYGFLAENPALARACAEQGLTFVGPSAEAIEAMASKVEARRRCQEAGVPVVPGGPAGSDEELLAAATGIGFPLMLKASAGGGGKGMRWVEDEAALKAALPSARREAEKAFGDPAVYLEKALIEARHLEVQLACDTHGNRLHLGVRECSLQRRHQKVIEETPPPNASQTLLDGLTAAALKLAEAIGYTNLGTVEFLVCGDEFYFLEMNTRLQVEHPVTESVTGLDLVEWQLAIAEGRPLPSTQIAFKGHAVEARLYSEDPANNFLPTSGPVLAWRPGPVRVDTALEPGGAVTTHYDPMLAKLVAWGPDRGTALRSLSRALRQTVLLGLTHNLDYLQMLLQNPAVEEGRMHTRLLEQLTYQKPIPSKAVVLAATAVRAGASGWSNLPFRRLELAFEGHQPVCLTDHHVHLETGAAVVDGWRFPFTAVFNQRDWWCHSPHGTFHLKALDRLPEPAASRESHGSLRAPMPGSIVEVLVAVGDAVEKNQALVKLEAMKMEHTVCSECAGTVEAVHYQPGDQVEADAQLVTVSPT
ncbi:MAG: biotin carboxylase N-terminal domain-containing protein [Vulcanimicrobiota bacterium]